MSEKKEAHMCSLSTILHSSDSSPMRSTEIMETMANHVPNMLDRSDIMRIAHQKRKLMYRKTCPLISGECGPASFY
ncbi:hypothetical protein TNCV_1221301 [Trichonephila clavipes]|nr:hypothetical protein TNCV_1221301 [Trichonephila clavipes]